jgi:hypothetical protein
MYRDLDRTGKLIRRQHRRRGRLHRGRPDRPQALHVAHVGYHGPRGLHLPNSPEHIERLHSPDRQLNRANPNFGNRLHHGQHVCVFVVHHPRRRTIRPQLCQEPGTSYRERTAREACNQRPGVLVHQRLLRPSHVTTSKYAITPPLSVTVTQPPSVAQPRTTDARTGTTADLRANLDLGSVVHGHRERLQRPVQLEQRVRTLQPAIHRRDGQCGRRLIRL